MTHPSQDALTANEQAQAVERAAVPGGENRLAQAAELLAAEYERSRYNTYAALAREQRGAFTMCAIRAIAAALASQAAAPPGAPPVSAHPAESAGEVERLKRERDHWKANHDEMAARNRLLRDRPDLPAERLASYDALVARTEAAEAKCRGLEGEVERLRDVKDIRDGITDALEAAGYFFMSNKEGVADICAAASDAEARADRLTTAARDALDTIWQLSNRGLSRAAARAQLAQINDAAREALASLVAVPPASTTEPGPSQEEGSASQERGNG